MLVGASIFNVTLCVGECDLDQRDFTLSHWKCSILDIKSNLKAKRHLLWFCISLKRVNTQMFPALTEKVCL